MYVYKKVSYGNESDSDVENERLLEYDNITKYHHAVIANQKDNIENTVGMYSLITAHHYDICNHNTNLKSINLTQTLCNYFKNFP